MTSKQGLLVVVALIVLLLQSLTIGYLAFDAPRQRSEQHQDMVNVVNEGLESTRNAFKAECGIDHQAPAEALHALVTELRKSTTKLQSCEKGLEALQGLAQDTKSIRAKVDAYLVTAPATPADLEALQTRISAGWPNEAEWRELRRLPQAFKCSGAAEDGCVEGQLALGASPTVVRQLKNALDLVGGKNSPLQDAIKNSTGQATERLEKALQDFQGRIDGAMLARNAVTLLNTSPTVDAKLSKTDIVVRVDKSPTLPCSDLSASITMAPSDSPTRIEPGLPGSIMTSSVSKLEGERDLTVLQIDRLALRAPLEEVAGKCQLRIGLGETEYKWFAARTDSHRLRVEFMIGGSGRHRLVSLKK